MAVTATAILIEQAEPVLRVRLLMQFAGRTVHSICIHLVDGLLIDTGCARSAPAVLQVLQGRHVSQVVNTHHHEDHTGANAAISARYGLLPQLHPAGLPYIQNPGAIEPFRRLVWGVPAPATGVALGDWVSTEHYRFRVIHTPGHAPDHVALFEEQQGWLFTGDLFLAPHVKLGTPFDDPWQILATLKRLQALPFDRLYCSHGKLLAGKAAHEALQERIRFWEWLGAEAHRLHAAGLSVGSLTRRLLGREPLLYYLSGGKFAQRRLIAQLLRSPEESARMVTGGWKLPAQGPK